MATAGVSAEPGMRQPTRRTAPGRMTVLGGGLLEFCVGKLLEFGADLSAWDEETRRAETG
jgi:hypothetical protein